MIISAYHYIHVRPHNYFKQYYSQTRTNNWRFCNKRRPRNWQTVVDVSACMAIGPLFHSCKASLCVMNPVLSKSLSIIKESSEGMNNCNLLNTHCRKTWNFTCQHIHYYCRPRIAFDYYALLFCRGFSDMGGFNLQKQMRRYLRIENYYQFSCECFSRIFST